jgi:hypothetical protein
MLLSLIRGLVPRTLMVGSNIRTLLAKTKNNRKLLKHRGKGDSPKAKISGGGTYIQGAGLACTLYAGLAWRCLQF